MTKTIVPSLDFFRLDERLTTEERAVRERVRAFAESRVIPAASEAWDAAELPTDIVDGLAELGIIGGTIKGYGCPGLSSTAYGLALQELARADGSVATYMGVHSSLAMGAVYYCGSDEQRQRWLPDMAVLRTVGAFALTEPEAGSDAAALQTRADRDGDSYVINGRKRWIGLGASCDFAVVWARTDDGQINGFVVPRETDGYEARKIEGKISLRAIHQADIYLTGVRVPAENRLDGFPGFRGTSEVLMHSRFGIAWGALGHALACYDAALTYARSRVQFGKPLASFQLVQEKLVQMLNRISLMQLACLQLSALRDQGALTTAMVSLVKLNNSAMARDTARDARDILGGNGILNEYDVMRHLDDLEAVYTYEGTHDINMLIVGREITGISAFK